MSVAYAVGTRDFGDSVTLDTLLASLQHHMGTLVLQDDAARNAART